MENFPPFVYQTLARLPTEQVRQLLLLAEEDKKFFWRVILKLRKYQRIQETGNISAWEKIKREDEKVLLTDL